MHTLTKSAGCGLLLLACSASPVALGQAYPSKPVRLVVGYAPGGGADAVSRVVAPKLADALGQHVVVENRPGANSVIAGEAVAKSPPDGYVVHVVTSSHSINPIAYPKLPYDTIRDFASISELATACLIMVVHPSLPATTVKQFIALARSRPGELQYASAGFGNITQLAAELFGSMAGTKLIHVPYKGSGPAIIDLIAGHVTVYFPPLPSALPQVRAGKLRALAVTGSQRTVFAPAVPTVSESGLSGYDAGSWYGLIAPARVPRDVIDVLHRASVKALQSADTQEHLKSQGLEAVGSSPEQFESKVKREIEKWRKVFVEANIKIE